jgi:hypothetical protein
MHFNGFVDFLIELLADIKMKFIFILSLCLLINAMLFVWIQPPGFAPDEPWHFLSANSASEKLFSGKDENCTRENALINHFEVESIKFNYSKKISSHKYEEVKNLSKSCYSYKSAILGVTALSYPNVLISKLILPINENPLRIYLFSKLINWMFLAIVLFRLCFHIRSKGRIAPPFLASIFVCMFSPLFAQQAVAVTYDNHVFSFLIMLISVFLFSEIWTYFDFALFIILGSFSMFAKPVLAPIILSLLIYRIVLLVIPFRETDFFLSQIKKILKDKLILICGLLLICAFMRQGLFLGEIPTEVQLRLTSQKNFFLQHWSELIAVFWDSINVHMKPSAFTGNVGWLDTPIGEQWSVYKYVFRASLAVDALVCGLWLSRAKDLDKLWRSLLMSCCYAVFFISVIWALNFVIAYELFTSWTKPNAVVLEGLQTRYFIPQFILQICVLSFVTRKVLPSFESEAASRTTPSGISNSLFSLKMKTAIALCACFPLTIFLVSLSLSLGISILERYY